MSNKVAPLVLVVEETSLGATSTDSTDNNATTTTNNNNTTTAATTELTPRIQVNSVPSTPSSVTTIAPIFTAPTTTAVPTTTFATTATTAPATTATATTATAAAVAAGVPQALRPLVKPLRSALKSVSSVDDIELPQSPVSKQFTWAKDVVERQMLDKPPKPKRQQRSVSISSAMEEDDDGGKDAPLSPTPSTTVAWGSGSGDEEDEVIGPATPRPSRSSRAPRKIDRNSFTRFNRRLTYDFQTNLKFLNTMPPTTRNRVTVLLFLVIGCVLLIVSLGAGLPLLGRVYDINEPVAVPKNGQLHNPGEFWGVVLLLFLGTGATMFLANMIPSLVVLNLPFTVVRITLALIAAAGAVGVALSMAYLIEPQKTYDDTVVIGSNDPILNAVGGFYIFSFGFLMMLSGGILMHMMPVFTPLRKKIRSIVSNFPHRAVSIIVLNILLCFSISCFLNNPVAAGETWAGRYFRTSSPYSLVNWQWSDNFIYKLFPDVLGYYLWISTIFIVSFMAQKYPRVKIWLHRRCYAPGKSWSMRLLEYHPFEYGISNGELLLFISFIGFNIFWVCYWTSTFDYIRNKTKTMSIEDVDAEIAARVMGLMTNLYAALTLLPTSRTGVWVEVFGVPYDRTIRYHRIIGMITFVFVTLHAWIWWNKWAKEGLLQSNIANIDNLAMSRYKLSYQDFTIPIMETIWFLMLLSLVTAWLLRRKMYPLFQYSHKYIGALFYVGATIHAWAFWYFSAGSLLLWFVDKLSRGIRAAYICAPDEVEWHPRNQVVIMKFSRDKYKSYEPGQYFFINIPHLSINEWHPFTASAVLDDGIIFYMKAMPKNPALSRIPWTQRLAELVQTSRSLPTVRLSGPFGASHLYDHRALVLFAGGIGITPMIAIFTHLLRKAKSGSHIGTLTSVTLIWMSRSVTEFRLFEQIFKMAYGSTTVLEEEDAKIEFNNCRFNIRLHCTRRDSWVSLKTPDTVDYVKMFVAQGRCDVADSLKRFKDNEDPKETLAAACGPLPLSLAVSQAAWELGVDYHAEQFSF